MRTRAGGKCHCVTALGTTKQPGPSFMRDLVVLLCKKWNYQGLTPKNIKPY